MTVDRSVIRELETIVGAEHVRTEPGDVEPYSRDATPAFRAVPDAVVWPRTAEEVAAILKLATARRVPVIPRGAGSNLCAATVAERGGIVMVLTRMDKILEVSAAELLARVETGVSTAALADAAAAKGLLYAPDPGSRTVSTVGGNVAMCAGGLRGLKYGVTRNYVLGTTVVLPTGEIMKTGGRLWKDVAGYDLTRLLTGSEGTLGVLTELTVALLPMPATSNTGVAYFPTLADAGRAVDAIIGHGIVPATLEFLDAKCIGAVEEYAHLGLRDDAGALLLFGDDGAQDVVDRNLDRIGEQCTATGALEVTLAENIARAQALLEARRCALPALSRLGHDDDPRGRDGAAAAAGRDGRPDRRDRARARRAGGHVRARGRRQPAPDDRGRPARRRRDQAGPRGVRRDLQGGDRDGRHDHRRARGGRGEAAVPDRPARRGPDGAAAPDQGRVRPGRDPQPGKAGS